MLLAQEHNIPHARQYMDSESSIKKLARPINPMLTVSAEADLLLAINHIRNQMPEPLLLSHVRAHQDDTTRFSDLPIEAQLNTICDENANRTRTNEIPSFYSSPPYTGSKAMLQLHGHWITSDYEKKISQSLTQPTHFKYITDRWGWTEDQYHSIRWSQIDESEVISQSQKMYAQ